MNKIAFIGVGVMGKPMVQHLTSAGYDVTIYTRTKSKVQDLIDLGITWKDSVYDCIQNQDIIMTMVGYPHDVKDIYYGPKGIINNAKPGAILIDLTTSSPKLAKAIYNDAKAYQLESLDAPVSGGDLGAKNATLSIMVGGDYTTFQKVQKILDILGTSLYVGTSGMGQHTKMAN